MIERIQHTLRYVLAITGLPLAQIKYRCSIRAELILYQTPSGRAVSFKQNAIFAEVPDSCLQIGLTPRRRRCNRRLFRLLDIDMNIQRMTVHFTTAAIPQYNVDLSIAEHLTGGNIHERSGLTGFYNLSVLNQLYLARCMVAPTGLHHDGHFVLCSFIHSQRIHRLAVLIDFDLCIVLLQGI